MINDIMGDKIEIGDYIFTSRNLGGHKHGIIGIVTNTTDKTIQFKGYTHRQIRGCSNDKPIIKGVVYCGLFRDNRGDGVIKIELNKISRQFKKSMGV